MVIVVVVVSDLVAVVVVICRSRVAVVATDLAFVTYVVYFVLDGSCLV